MAIANEPKAGAPLQRRAADERLTRHDLWRLFALVAAMAFLIILFGGLAFRAYVGVRFTDMLPKPDRDWWVWLITFAVAGAIAIAAVAICWRLAHRKKDEARWGRALALLLVVLFGLLVWPTPWTYREYGCKIFQINRFLGRMTPLETKVPGCEPEAPAPR